MTKQRLVVIGNGMAGARAVEEILARGGADLFDIVMFGEEPYGNYNRILLSTVVNGSQDPSEIFLNSLAWYKDNDVTLHAGIKALRIDRVGKRVYGACGVIEPYDKLIIATGSRPFIPPVKNVETPDGKLRPGRLCLPDARRLPRDRRRGRDGQARGAVIGGGLLGLEAARGLLTHGCEVHVVQRSATLMNQQLDGRREAGTILRTIMEELGIHVHLEKSTTAVLGEERVTGLAFKDGSTLDCDMVAVAAGIKPNAEIGARCGLTVGRAIVVDDHMRSVADPARLCRRRMRPAPRSGLRLGRSAVGAGQGVGRPYHRQEREGRLLRLQARHEAQGDGRGARLDGGHGAGGRARRGHPVLGAEARAVQEAHRPQGTSRRRHHARRHQQGRLPHAGLRQGGAAAGGPPRAALRHRRAAPEGELGGDARRRAGLQLQRRLEGRDRRVRHPRQADGPLRHAGDARGHGLRLVQVARLRRRRALLRRRARGGSGRALLRAGDPALQSRSSWKAIRERGLR